MPTKKSTSDHKTKKQLVLEQPTRKFNPYILTVTLALVIFAALAAYWVWTAPNGNASHAKTASSGAAQEGPSEIAYALALFNDGQARHFEHAYNGSTIRYFILKSADGVVRAAFDACDVCWPAGKGYTQSGDDMVCRNCGRRFASNLINEVQGGCNPAPLQRQVQGEQVVIRTADIVQGYKYFNFKEKV